MNKMNNSERYKAGFDNLHLSDDFRTRLSERLEKEREDEKVKNISFWNISRVAAAIAVCTIACGSVCYAADVGGIRTNIQLWINGKNENVEVTDMGDGSYTWTDQNGEEHGFGGFTATDDGEVTAISVDEMASYMNNSAELEFENGKILFHYHNLSEDVTDLISSDGKFYIHVDDPANPNTYFEFEEIKPEGTYSVNCSNQAESSGDYHEADVTGLISGKQADELDENTALSFTTMVVSD